MVAIRAGPMAAAAALLRLLPALLLLLSCCCPRHASAARAVFAVRDAAAISAGRPLGSSGSRVLLQEERNKLIDTGAVAGEPAFAIPTSSPIVSAPPATPGPDVQQPPSPGFAPPTAGGAIPTSPIISGAQPEDQHREVTPPPVVVAQPPPLAPAPVPEVQQKKNRTEPTDEPAAGGEELGALPTPAVSVAQPEGQRQQEPTEPVAPPLAAVPTALGNETGDALVPATSIIPITEANETTTLREGTVGNATVLPEAPTAAPAPGTSLNETQQQQLPGNATLPSGNATLPSDAVILPGDVEAAPEAAANIKEPAGEAQTELLGGLQPGEVLTKPEEVLRRIYSSST